MNSAARAGAPTAVVASAQKKAGQNRWLGMGSVLDRVENVATLDRPRNAMTRPSRRAGIMTPRKIPA
ncbi:hypothetical protein [Chenggangzhangella methanolivorans]|uniref:Uncharacterized protein n=1 Tax=Chenggangzhangella methanolivorans TaxID=1437009 RepID=A0A9E6R5S2_9HYPH|nr:hypothetical protein [Chenggangzhangella methanolivorans]QZN98359.1 hypothetical protein K6K41_14695 [Chenggangzhangella methanolivorans]